MTDKPEVAAKPVAFGLLQDGRLVSVSMHPHNEKPGWSSVPLYAVPPEVPPREPTEQMQEAGRHAFFADDSGLKRREMLLAVRKMWRAMFDAWKDDATKGRQDAAAHDSAKDAT